MLICNLLNLTLYYIVLLTSVLHLKNIWNVIAQFYKNLSCSIMLVG